MTQVAYAILKMKSCLIAPLLGAVTALASLDPRAGCTHSATDRDCWDGTHDIDTNWYL